jgi:hypothetical protein
MPWTPPPIALNCYKPLDKNFFEGLGLTQRNKMTGRESELEELKQIIEKSQTRDKTAVAITGIGGIGYVISILERNSSASEC